MSFSFFNDNPKRVLLKLSGEIFSFDDKSGVNIDKARKISKDIVDIKNSGFSISIVIGGGNILRGEQFKYIKRTDGDSIGMMATAINALMVKSILIDLGCDARVFSPISIGSVVDLHSAFEAKKFFDSGGVPVFAYGLGASFLSTDTCAVVRALELECSVVMKGTTIDGVFDADPSKNKDANFLNKVSYDRILVDKLEIMDLSAIAVAKKNNLPIIVFSVKKFNMLADVLNGTGLFSLIC